jgi:hypothetical protein
LLAGLKELYFVIFILKNWEKVTTKVFDHLLLKDAKKIVLK